MGFVNGFPFVFFMIIGNGDDAGSIGSVPISRVAGSDSIIESGRSYDDSLINVGSDESNSFNSVSKSVGSKSLSTYRKTKG